MARRVQQITPELRGDVSERGEFRSLSQALELFPPALHLAVIAVADFEPRCFTICAEVRPVFPLRNNSLQLLLAD